MTRRTLIATVLTTLASSARPASPPNAAVEVRGVVSSSGEREIRLLEDRIRLPTVDRTIAIGELAAMAVNEISVGQAVALIGAVGEDGKTSISRMRVLHPSMKQTSVAGVIQITEPEPGSFSLAGVQIEWDDETKRSRLIERCEGRKRVVVDVELRNGHVRATGVRRESGRNRPWDVAAWLATGVGLSGTSDTPR